MNVFGTILALLTYLIIAIITAIAYVIMLPFRFVVAVLWFINTGQWVFTFRSTDIEPPNES